jgi:hypothetical protein
MAAPLGVLSVFLAVDTTEVEEDINGGPPRGCCRYFWQRLPSKLKKMSMTGTLEGVVGISGNGYHRS